MGLHNVIVINTFVYENYGPPYLRHAAQTLAHELGHELSAKVNILLQIIYSPIYEQNFLEHDEETSCASTSGRLNLMSGKSTGREPLDSEEENFSSCSKKNIAEFLDWLISSERNCLEHRAPKKSSIKHLAPSSPEKTGMFSYLFEEEFSGSTFFFSYTY